MQIFKKENTILNTAETHRISLTPIENYKQCFMKYGIHSLSISTLPLVINNSVNNFLIQENVKIIRYMKKLK